MMPMNSRVFYDSILAVPIFTASIENL